MPKFPESKPQERTHNVIPYHENMQNIQINLLKDIYVREVAEQGLKTRRSKSKRALPLSIKTGRIKSNSGKRATFPINPMIDEGGVTDTKLKNTE